MLSFWPKDARRNTIKYPQSLSKGSAKTHGQLLELAQSFVNAQTSSPSIRDTFVYFIDHPVAPLNQKRLEEIVARAERASSALGRQLNILDLAGGVGLIATALAVQGHRVIGFDLDDENTRAARAFYELAVGAFNGIGGAEFPSAVLCADTSWQRVAEKFLGNKLDLVIAAYALHHPPEVDEFLVKLGQFMARGSILLVNEENHLAPTFGLKHIVRTYTQKDTDVEHHRSLNGWTKLLNRAGFRSKVVKLPGSTLPPPLAAGWLVAGLHGGSAVAKI